MSDIAIKIENLKKQYKLGAIGGQTLSAALQSWWAQKRGKEDPNQKIGQEDSRTGETFWALKGINFEIKQGEAVGIIGRNGAGKSTLLKILSRVTAPTEGDVWINGRIAAMLEVGTGFHGELTGRENIYMNGAILGMSRKEVDAKIESIIDFSECRQFIDTPVKRYSSGMYVKLAFAVASHLDAEIMVMDEVLAVGDMAFQTKCLGKMGKEAHAGKTVLYVSHNMATIRSLCSRCVVLDKGLIVFDGSVDEAIAVYMKNDLTEFPCKYNFQNLQRSIPDLGKKMRITEFSFDSKEIPIYESQELMKFTIHWTAYQNVKNVRVRIEVYYADGMIAGMAESKPFVTVHTGDKNKSSFSFSMKNLAPGTYNFRLSLFTLNSMCVHTGIDESVGRIYFQVIDTRANRTRWLRQYWGSIRLDDIMSEP